MPMLKLSKKVTLHVPMAVELRDALKLRAQYLGFESIQSLIRFWATAQVEGRKVDWDDDDWEPDRLALIVPEASRLPPTKPPKSQPPKGLGWR